jgi:5-methylcytosine-specific restriction protein A
MRRVYRQRRRLVARLLDERPVCQRCGRARSVDVHELKSRARGGSILDESNCVALCRACHDFVTTHPADAEAEGFLLPSWAAPATDQPNGATS